MDEGNGDESRLVLALYGWEWQEVQDCDREEYIPIALIAFCSLGLVWWVNGTRG